MPEVFDLNGHQVHVTPATAQHSAIYECVTCRTGFFHSAALGDYASPNPCPELALVWALIVSKRGKPND